MTPDDDFLKYYVPPDTTAPSPDTTAPSLTVGPEDPIPWIPRATPPYEPPAPERRNAWAPWSLVIALVAVVFGGVVAIIEINAVHVTYDGFGRPHPAPIPGGSAWLQGRFFTSWWAAAALLLIAFAVAAGVRSLTLIRRDAAPGLGITVSGFAVSSVALMIGNAGGVGLLGAITSFVVYGIFYDRLRAEGAVATNSAIYPRAHIATKPAVALHRGRISPRTTAMLAIVGVVLGPPLSFSSFAGALVGIPLTIVGFVFTIDALRLTRATGEAGRGWAIGAIVVVSIVLVLIACLLLFIWLLSQAKWV